MFGVINVQRFIIAEVYIFYPLKKASKLRDTD
jgi:hypothetical protein